MKYQLPIEVAELEPGTFHLFVHLNVGKETCRLLLDTGASKTVLDAEKILKFVESEHVKANDTKSVGLGVDAMETQMSTLSKVKAGKLKVKKMEVAVLPLSHVNETYRMLSIKEVDGVLGSDFLMKYQAVIDLRKAQLTLRK